MRNPMSFNPDEIIYEEDDQFEYLPEGQKKVYYLYELKKLIRSKSDALLTFSPNSVNLVIIDKDEYVRFDAWKPEAQTFEYRTKTSFSNIDGEVDIAQYQKETIYTNLDLNGGLNFENGIEFNYSRNKLYMVSEFLLETDDDINNFGYLIQKIDVDSPLTDGMLGKKVIEIVDLNTWAACDSNNAIFRIGKQLDELEVTGIKLTCPSSFLLNSIQALGEDKRGFLTNPKIYAKTPLIPLYVNPIEVLDTGSVNLFNFWMLDTILPLEDAKQYIDIDGKSINAILPGNDKEEPGSQVIDVDNLDRIEMTADGTYVFSRARMWMPNVELSMDDKPFSNESFTIPGRIAFEPNIWQMTEGKSNSTITKISRMVIYTKEKLQKSPIYDLLVEVLEASYNYKNNFKGAGYKNDKTGELNKMALYKQQFEGKTIAEYIDGLENNWVQDNPKLLDDLQYKNYKKVRPMLSHNIFGSLSINQGKNEDNKFLLPWYFELMTKPIWVGSETPNDGNGKWEYKDDIKVNLKSLYFDLEKIKQKKYDSGIGLMNLISESTILQNNNDKFIWPLLPNNIDQSELPSLSVKDLQLSDNNVGKYLTFVDSDLIKYFGKRNDILKLTALDSFNLYSNPNKDLEFSLKIKNVKHLDITGLYGSGSWDIELLTGKSNVLIQNIDLFKFNKQSISRIKVLI